MKPIYNLFIKIYPVIAGLISSKNEKARLWIAGRKNIFQHIETALKDNKAPIIWMHCASLGEFEQGRPLLEKIKQEQKESKIFLTFFSPSGYEVRKNYAGADWIFYLPMDSAKNARLFFDLVKPTLVLFVKYEFWFYYLKEAKQRNTPLLLVSGIFRPGQAFFKWYGGFYRNMLQCFTHFFLQTKDAKQLLANINITGNVSVSGDTRFDRVLEIAEGFKPLPIIENFITDHQVIVSGSTWSADDEELDHYANTHQEIKFIIAPHDISEERIKECLRLYKNAILYSQYSAAPENNPGKNVLIIDNIGMLSKLYKYATVTYVGGGFGGDGVHNVLEAAVYYKPVIYGPEYDKFIEAEDLIESGGGYSIKDALELEKQLDELMLQGDTYKQACESAGNYVKNNAGATELIMLYLRKNVF